MELSQKEKAFLFRFKEKQHQRNLRIDSLVAAIYSKIEEESDEEDSEIESQSDECLAKEVN